MTAFTWTITSPFISLNSTVYYTLNTSGRAPRNWPQDGPSMPGPSITPEGISDTIVIYHNGHETNKCTPNFDGNVDYFNQLGYDVMEMFMPLYGCNAVAGIDSNHHWFHQWEDKGDYPIRFFIEPIILTINHALSLGYTHVVLTGLSGAPLASLQLFRVKLLKFCCRWRLVDYSCCSHRPPHHSLHPHRRQRSQIPHGALPTHRARSA